MIAQSLKRQAIETISRLPETVDFNEMMYELYVVEKAFKGLEALDKGDSLTEEELREQIKRW